MGDVRLLNSGAGRNGNKNAYDIDMALSEDDKLRIREEELFRLQVRRGLRQSTEDPKGYGRWVALFVPLFVMGAILWSRLH